MPFLPLLAVSFTERVANVAAYDGLSRIDKLEKALVLYDELKEQKDVVQSLVDSGHGKNDYYEIIPSEVKPGDHTFDVDQLKAAITEESESFICVVYKLNDTIYDVGEPFKWSLLLRKIEMLRTSITQEAETVFKICEGLKIHEGMDYVGSDNPLYGFLETLEETRYKLATLLTGG